MHCYFAHANYPVDIWKRSKVRFLSRQAFPVFGSRTFFYASLPENIANTHGHGFWKCTCALYE
jgi:hypothetical protein